MNKEIEKPQGRERALRYGLEIDRVPLPLKSLTIEAASRLAGLPAAIPQSGTRIGGKKPQTKRSAPPNAYGAGTVTAFAPAVHTPR